MDKTPDPYRTISEVADDLDLPQHVLRFWETRFGQIKPLKRAGGRRFYRPDDVDLLKGIRHLLYNEGYTIKGVQRILKEQGVRAILALVRNNGLEAEPEAALTPPTVAPARIAPEPLQPAPLLLQQEAVRQASLRQEPPPLATPHKAPEWRAPLDLEAEFAAFHAQGNAQDEAETQEDTVPHGAAHAAMPPSQLPAPPAIPAHTSANPFTALPLSFGAPFQVPLAPNPVPGQVSMFRGGIAVQPKNEPQQKSEAPPPPSGQDMGAQGMSGQGMNRQGMNRQAATTPPLTTSLAPAPAAPASFRREEHEAEEARAILTLALQELGTCREMIEQLRAPLRAAE